MGLSGKGDIDGSMVADRWEAGEFEAIREYNVDDVRTVRAIWRRITGEDAPKEDEVAEEMAVVGTEVEVPVAIVEDPLAVEVPSEVVPEPTVEPVVQKPVVKRQVVPVFLRDVLPSDRAA